MINGRDRGLNGKKIKTDKPKDYEVGRGKAPVSRRFGEAGGNPINRKGRPKHTKNIATMFKEEVFAPLTIEENGKKITLSKLQVALKQQTNKAVKGDSKATKELVSRCLQILPPPDDEGAEAPPLNEAEEAVLQNWVDMHAFLDGKKGKSRENK